MLAGTTAAVENGVSLTGLTDVAEDAAYLAQAVAAQLDNDWIPQPIHAAIGAEVGRLYTASRAANGGEGGDLNSVLVDVGTGLMAFDLGDAFVGPWDVANSVTELLMARLGRGGDCGCNSAPPAPHFTVPSVAALRTAGLDSHFGRYKLLATLLDDGAPDTWAQLSVAAGLLMGYTVQLDQGVDVIDARQVKPAWLKLTAGAPPQLAPSAPLVLLLENELAADGTEDRDMLVELVRVMHGEEMVKLADEQSDVNFQARSKVVQWMHLHDFLSRDDLGE